MPRKPRIFVEGGIFHVYNRFARGAEVFREGDEADRFLDLLRKVRDRDGLTIFAWALMSNHYHLAFRAGPIPLSRTMGYVQSRFGQSYNRRWKSTGPLWQSRYKAQLVEDQRYYAQLVIYIHLNPVKAKLVDDPADYPYSGHLELLKRSMNPLIEVDSVLAEFGDSLRSARSAYVRTLGAESQSEWIGERPGALPWWKHEPDRSLEPANPDAWIDELGRSTGLERPHMSTGQYLVRACRGLGIEPSRIAGGSQDHETSRLRYLVGALAIERWGIRAKELGELLGRRPEVVTRWAARGAGLRTTNDTFGSQYDRLDRFVARTEDL